MVMVSVALAALVEPGLAQDPDNPLEMQRTISVQQQQLESQQLQLDAQKQLLEQLQSEMQSLSAPSGAGAAGQPTNEPVQPPPEAGAVLSQNFKYERVVPTSSNFTAPDSALKFTTPGFKTEIGIHGFTEAQIILDTNGLNNNEFDTSFIPIPSEPSQTKFSVNPSKFGISSATPVECYRVNTMITVDFNGELDQPMPRLRVAYGEIINDDRNVAFMAGQFFTTTVDLKSQPETLDFAGPTGLFARRQPLVKFSKLYGREVLTEMAIETPEGSIFRNADALTGIPAFVYAVNWLPEGDRVRNLRFACLARDLRGQAASGLIDKAFGWAFIGSGRVMLPMLGEKDNFCFNVEFGDGYGGQLKSGPADAVLNLATSELTTIGVFGSYGGVQHWWTDSVRSNVVWGYNAVDNPDFIDVSALNSTLYSSANLVWNPTKKVTLGIEFLFGNRKNVDGASGEDSRLMFSSRFIY